MKIEDYFCIPIKEKKQKRYLSILKIVMSFSTAIFIILLHKMFGFEDVINYYEGSKARTDFSIVVLLWLASITKSCYYFNFKYKSGQIPGIQPSLRAKQIIIPTLVKCFLYIGLTKVGALYLYSLDGACVILLNMVFIEYFRMKATKQNINLFRQMVLIILLAFAIVLTTKQYKFSEGLTKNLFLLTFGTLSFISYYDLNVKVFEIYKPSVEQFMAKQYITQFIIYSTYSLICLLTQNQIEQTLFIIQKFPYVILFVILLAAGEYSILQFLKKQKFGDLVFSVFSGLGWVYLYFLIKKDIVQQRFIYGLIFFLASFIIMTDIFQYNFLIRGVQFLLGSQRQPQRFSVAQ